MVQHKVLELAIPCYVYRYLVIEYGEGPYEISLKRGGSIKRAFEYYSLQVDLCLPALEVPTALVIIRLHYPEYSKFREIRKQIDRIVKTDTFFMFEFWQAAVAFIDGVLAIDKSLGKRKALQIFLDRYEISEDLFPIDNAYRELLRITKRRSYASASPTVQG